jgi:hypothetical protein
LLQLKDQGLKDDPELAIGDGALGFWKALPQVFPTTKKQRCWVHKTANVLNKLPKRQQPEAKQALWQIYRADTKAEANTAFDRFLKTYQVKYPEATECLSKDREALLAFFDFPAEHWAHIRTTNPIESTFATVRLRTDKTRGCVSKDTILALVFKLVQSAEKRWLRIRGFKYLADVIEGVPFKDGLRVEEDTQMTDPACRTPLNFLPYTRFDYISTAQWSEAVHASHPAETEHKAPAAGVETPHSHFPQHPEPPPSPSGPAESLQGHYRHILGKDPGSFESFL